MHDKYNAFGRDLLQQQKSKENSAPPQEHEYHGRNIFDFLPNNMIKILVKGTQILVIRKISCHKRKFFSEARNVS